MADIIAFQLPLDGLSSYSQKTTWLLDQSPVYPGHKPSRAECLAFPLLRRAG